MPQNLESMFDPLDKKIRERVKKAEAFDWRYFGSYRPFGLSLKKALREATIKSDAIHYLADRGVAWLLMTGLITEIQIGIYNGYETQVSPDIQLNPLLDPRDTFKHIENVTFKKDRNPDVDLDSEKTKYESKIKAVKDLLDFSKIDGPYIVPRILYNHANYAFELSLSRAEQKELLLSSNLLLVSNRLLDTINEIYADKYASEMLKLGISWNYI